MDIILSKFYEFLVQNVPKMVVKIPSQAKLYETIESKQAGDTYVTAMNETDNIYSYQSFSDELMQTAGFTLIEIDQYRESNNDPDFFTDKGTKTKVLLSLARKKYIDEYEEQNDYYRMLAGLPGYQDDEEIWFDDFDLYDKYSIEPCPVHEIKQTILNAMETRGELESLKESHPDARYLEFLGCRRINPFVSRTNEAFALLYFPNNGDTYSFYRDFVTYYESCREYFLTIIYNQYFNSKYDHYDGLIGFMILTMTINKIIAGNFKAFIERDFYDSLSTATFLNAYGIYYDERFNLSQTKLIAKNLNILLMNKSTDVALLDVLDLLGFHDYTLMKYYLLKSHKMDGSGKPLFLTKKVTDEEGIEIEVPDESSIYEYKFVRVPVTTTNLQDALDEVENMLSYTSVTQEDPYWVNDQELLDKLQQADFNYIDTKYMDLVIVYRMYAIMFELAYFCRLVLDKKNETQHILVSMAKISLSEVPVFDVLILLICLTCKFYKFKPVILKSPDKILKILGFNFDADIEAIRQDIANNPRLYSQELLNYLQNPILITPNDINNLYLNIKKFDRKLISLMNTASDLKSYRAYKKLYETLMYIDNNPNLYADNEGNVPETYTDYLAFKNPELYKLLSNTEGEDACSELINYITSRLSAIFTNTKYLKYIQIIDDSLIDSILRVLCFFKSYTVHMRGANIVLLFDSRIYNMAHLYHKFEMDGNMEILDVIGNGNARYWDIVKDLSASITLTEENATTDEIMKAMSDMQPRINLYTSYRVKMQEVGLHIPDKSNLGLLFDVPRRSFVDMEYDPMTINLELCEYAIAHFDPRIDLSFDDDDYTITAEERINKFIFASQVDLVEMAVEFANMKLSTYENKERFMSKILLALMVKVPSKLFSSGNARIVDKVYTKYDITKNFYNYEETMDTVYLNEAVEQFMTTILRDLYIQVGKTRLMGSIDMKVIQEYYMRNVLRLLSECKLSNIYISITDNINNQIINIVHKELPVVVHKLLGNITNTIRVKYRLHDSFIDKQEWVPTINIHMKDRLYSSSPSGTTTHFSFNKKDRASFSRETIQFVWSE